WNLVPRTISPWCSLIFGNCPKRAEAISRGVTKVLLNALSQDPKQQGCRTVAAERSHRGIERMADDSAGRTGTGSGRDWVVSEKPGRVAQLQNDLARAEGLLRVALRLREELAKPHPLQRGDTWPCGPAPD